MIAMFRHRTNAASPMPTRRLFRSPLLLAALMVLLSACAAKARMDFYARDVSCQALGRGWQMPDSTGVMRTTSDLKGKVSYVFFGFTSCPDVCPTTLVELGKVKHLMGSDAGSLQVVFVTVDPQRDTPAVARTYVQGFDPTAMALVGSETELAAMADTFKAYYQREPDGRTGAYTMSHTAGGYLFDRQGRLRLFAPYGLPVEQLFSDIQRLLLEPEHRLGIDAVSGCRTPTAV